MMSVSKDVTPAVAHKTSPLSDSLSIVLARAVQENSQVNLPSLLFDQRVGWMEGYDGLFAERPTQGTSWENLLEKAMSSGRVLLAGRGGAGKTIVLQRVRGLAIERGFLPVYVSLQRWTGKDYETWETLTENSDRLDFLLGRFASSQTTLPELDAFGPNVEKVLLVDGLNEVTTEVGSGLLDALDYFARTMLQSGVIVADRLVRRQGVEQWSLSTLLPLSDEEISRLVAGFASPTKESEGRELLRIPFFLNQFLESGNRPTNSAAALGQIFRDVVKLTHEEETAASQGGFETYEKTGSRTFSLHLFSSIAGQATTNKLAAAGALRIEGETAFFDHHLKHDYLAANWVHLNPSLWTHAAFDKLSFNAASFDALPIVLELTGSDQADKLVAAIYDWNQYGAGYAIAEAQRHGASAVSTEMLHVVLAMLAEKRWEPIKGTAQRATDALEDFLSETAAPYRSAANLSELINYVAKIHSNSQWFCVWRDLYSKQPGSTLTEDDLVGITFPGSIHAWTLANVLRRIRVSARQQRLLREFLATSDGVVAWRIAHAFGAHPSPKNAQALVSLLDKQEFQWAQFGAVRSLVEMAARGSERLRKWIFSQLARRVSLLNSSRIIRDELLKALFMAETPPDWPKQARKVLVPFYELATDPAGRNYWLRVLYKLDSQYAK